jgi:hypothetical protein
VLQPMPGRADQRRLRVEDDVDRDVGEQARKSPLILERMKELRFL